MNQSYKYKISKLKPKGKYEQEIKLFRLLISTLIYF